MKIKYFVVFSISAFTGCYNVIAESRAEALKKVKKRFDKDFQPEFRYPKFSIQRVK